MYWMPVILYAAAVFINSCGPSAISLPCFPHADKVIHFAAYAVMGWLMLRAVRRSFPAQRGADIFFWSTLLACLYGASDELHQWFVPQRDASPGDLIADCLGSIAGGWILLKMAASEKKLFRKMAGAPGKR
jgi:VanZ family protein